MFRNYQFIFKRINRQHVSFWCLTFLLFTKCCFCKANDNTYSFNFENEKSVSDDPEELIRRRNVVESYLKESGGREKDWIETYHNSFPESSAFKLRKTIQPSSVENKRRIHGTFPFQNEDISSLKNLDNSVYHDESLFYEKNSNENTKYETMSSKKISDQILKESLKRGKNDDANQDSLNNDHDEILNFRVSTKISELNKIVHKYPEKSHVKFSFVKNEDLKMNEFKNLSKNENKVIQILLKKSKFIFEKYFINGEALTLTEFYKLQENLASLSFLQTCKNNVYSINRMNIIDSVGKLTPLLKQDDPCEGKPKCTFPVSDNNIASESFHYKDCNRKNVKTDLEKRVGYKIGNNEKRVKNSFLSDARKNEKYSLEGSDEKDFPLDSEILRRKKIVNTFMATLDNNQEDWIETYHFNYLQDKPEIKNAFNFQKMAKQNDKFSKVYSQERLYIIRWINMLLSKLKDSHSGYYSILVSNDLNKILGDLSREFDIVMFDELVNNMISNATLHNNYAKHLYFDYEYIFNAVISLSLNSTKMCIFIIFLFFSILLYNLFKIRPNNNFSLYRIFAFVIPLLILFSLFWHGSKMYQQKIAEKHTVMSRVVPSYCESILAQESGVIAHFKEYFRFWWYNEDCKKYYEALMVDPSSEINPFSISSDLLADIFFQMLQPFARNMNLFFKALTYDLSFYQQCIIIIVTFFSLIAILYFSLSVFACLRKYKVTFPFHFGSVEPTEFCKGSRVEEVEETSALTDFSTSCDASLVNYKNETENKNYTEDIVLKENVFKIQSQFKLDQPKHCVLKTYRTRRNSF